MRHISFALTVRQIHDLSKRVTRRDGWKDLKVGTLLQPIEKGQGLKKGEHPVPIDSPILVTDVRFEPLQRMLDDPAYGARECILEGFPELSPAAFVAMFLRTHKGVTVATPLARIAFDYVEQMVCPACHHRMNGVGGMCTVTEGSCRCCCIEELAKKVKENGVSPSCG